MSAQDQDTKGLGAGSLRDKNKVHDLWDTLQAQGRFSRFLKAAGDAQLEARLHGPEWLTVFAVPDEVLASENEETLRALIPQHVVRGMQKHADLRVATSLRSIDGPQVSVSLDCIDRADIVCSNGVVHVVKKPISECALSS
jgi:uncharacterized surface protein with fasciclin (FAS1) repeats